MRIPDSYQDFLTLSPEQVQQLCDELVSRPLDSNNSHAWLEDWGKIAALFQECMARFDVALSINTADETAREQSAQYRENIFPIGHRLSQQLNQRLQEQAELLPTAIRESDARRKQANQLNQSQAAIDLLNREAELMNQYQAIMGKQAVEWDGATIPLRQLNSVLQESDRSRREQAWHTIYERHAQDSEAIHEIWRQMLDIRAELAEINGFDNYLDYRWTELVRTDYTPEDSRNLHVFLLKHFGTLYETTMNNAQDRLQLPSIKPWDMEFALASQRLRPFATHEEALQKTVKIFRRMDAEFGAYVQKLIDMDFVHLTDGTNASSVGGFSRAIGRHGNFIFLYVQHTTEDVISLVHEIGHALAMRASCKLPYLQLWGFPSDFIETPSTTMEMLTQPYWHEFCSAEDLPIARRQYFQKVIQYTLFETGFAAFQHWVYQNMAVAHNPDECAAQWQRLMSQYLPSIDWTGVAHLYGIGWQRLSLNFYLPLHALEYVYGRLAGLQLLTLSADEAHKRYKESIALGNGASTKELFAALGVNFPYTEDDVQKSAHKLVGYLSDRTFA